MIYVVGKMSVIAKQTYAAEVIQSDWNTVKGIIAQDPEVSKLDLLLLSSESVIGARAKQFTELMREKHPKIRVVYIYSKPKEASKESGIDQFHIARVNIAELKKTVDPILAEIAEIGKSIHGPGKKEERTIAEIDSEEKIGHTTFTEEIEDKPKYKVRLDFDTSEFDTNIEDESSTGEGSISNYTSTKEDDEPESVKEVKNKTLQVSNIIDGDFINVDLIRQMLNSDNIAKTLMSENMTYQGATNMLMALDAEILVIYKDTSLTPNERLNKIRELGLKKASHVDIKNNFITDRMISIINTIVDLVSKLSDDRIQEMTKLLDTFSKADGFFRNEDELNKQINLRLQKRLEINTLLNSIYQVYQVIDQESSFFIQHMADELPTSNAFINTLMSHISQIFLPQHMNEVINRLNYDVANSRGSLSVIESQIRRLNDLVLEYNKTNEEIVSRQQKSIDMLQVNNVEAIVVCDTLIKNSLRVFIGASDIGRTATVVTSSGLDSRVRNTLLLNFSKDVSLERYGAPIMDYHDFMSTKIAKPFICCNVDLKNDVVFLKQIIRDLVFKLDYYSKINFLFDENQMRLVSEIAPEVLSVTFITNSTQRSMGITRDLYKSFTTNNVARRLIVIDPPRDKASFLDAIGIDPLTTKLILIPHMTEMREFAIRNQKPYEVPDVGIVFSEAF